MFTSPGLTSVAVSSINNYTVVFLGTANGRLLKVKWPGNQKAMDVFAINNGVSFDCEPPVPKCHVDGISSY